jgi:hypothetical protein
MAPSGSLVSLSWIFIFASLIMAIFSTVHVILNVMLAAKCMKGYTQRESLGEIAFDFGGSMIALACTLLQVLTSDGFWVCNIRHHILTRADS